MRSLSSHLNNTKENLVLQYLTCYVPICILINDEFITIIYIIPIIRIRFNNVPTAYFPKQHPSTIKKRFSDVYLIHRTHTHTHTPNHRKSVPRYSALLHPYLPRARVRSLRKPAGRDVFDLETQKIIRARHTL